MFGCSAKQHHLGANPHYQKLTLAAVEKQSFVSQADLDTLLIQTRYASDEEKNKLYLTISRRLTQDAQYKLAKALLDNISNPDTETQIETAMLKTQQHLNLREFTAASRTLKKLQFSSAQDSYRYHLLRAWYYYERGSYPSYILALDTLTPT